MNLTSTHHSASTRDTSGNGASGSPLDGHSAGTEQSRIDWRRLLGVREMGVYYALILLVAVLSAVTAYTGGMNYLSIANVTNVLYQSSIVGIMAVAMTVILITGNFDLSVASVAALSAAVVIGLGDSIGFWPAAGAAIFVAVIVGLLNGSIVQYLGINAFIVTLGTLTAIRGVVQIYTDGRSLALSEPSAIDAMHAFESGRVQIGWALLVIGALFITAAILVAVRSRRAGRGIPVASFGMALAGFCLIALDFAAKMQIAMPKPVIYMVVYTTIVWFVLSMTNIGRRVYAVGGNAEAARLSGINVKRYKMAGFILCSATAGLGGVLFGSRLGAINPTALQGAELTVIASAILGGTSLFGGAGSVVKTLAGALLLFSLTNGFNILNLGANYQGVIEGTVVVAAAAIYTVGGNKRRGK